METEFYNRSDSDFYFLVSCSLKNLQNIFSIPTLNRFVPNGMYKVTKIRVCPEMPLLRSEDLTFTLN